MATTMPRGLTDREYQKFVEDPPGSGQVALAVAARDGGPLVPLSVEDLLQALLLEQRRTNLLLEMLTGQEVQLADVAT